MMLHSDFDKILLIQTASIGDVILTTPLIEKIHFHFPDAKIDILVKNGNQSLFFSHPFINRILVWDKSKEKYKNFWKIFNEVKDSRYSIVVNVQRFALTGLLTAFSGAKIKIGFNKNPFSIFFNQRVKHTIKKGQLHETERNQRLIYRITDDKNFEIKLYPGKTENAKMSQYKTVPYITVSPASLWFTKQFPQEKWIEFLKQVNRDLVIYFLGSPKDQELSDQIIKLSDHQNSLNLCGKLSFLESAALMKDARMNFMNDSAPLHLASSVNAKTTAIFCSTVPQFGFGPTADDSVVVEINEDLECRPCGLHGFKSCPKKHFKCALSINTSDLLKRVNYA